MNKVIKLGRISTIYNGSTPDTRNILNWDGDVPWITPADLKGDKYVSNGKRNITEIGVKNSNLVSLPKNTVLLTSRAPIGKVALAQNTLHTNQGFKNIVINESIMLPEFLYYFLYISEEKLNILGKGTTFREISKIDVSNLKVPCPEISIQKKIIQRLNFLVSRINTIISETLHSIEELNKYKQSIITEAVTKGLDPNVEMKDSGIVWVGKIPKDWIIIPSNLLFFNSVKKAKGEVELLTASQKYGVISQRKFMELETQVPVQKRNLNDLKEVQKGDFVISLRSFQGGIEIAQESGGVTPAYTVLKQKNKDVHPDYYKYFFKSRMYIQALRSTVLDTIRDGKSIKFSHFSKVPLILPPFDKQVEISIYLDRFSNSINNLTKDKNKLIEELEQYKKSLIYEYVTGKKEV